MKKFLLFTLLPMATFATPIKGFEANYQDWDLVCDNTGTCRMAGYQNEEKDEALPVSLLFTRLAGENASVSGELYILPIGENEEDVKAGENIEIWLNGKSLGTITHLSDENPDKLTPTQTKALLNGLKKSSEIRVTYGKNSRPLSDKGAMAAMLKMDEFQQRLNTPSALIRQGESKKAVLAPQKVPTIQAVKVPNQKETRIERGSAQFDNLLALLRQANGTDESKDNYCYGLESNKEYPTTEAITIYPLTQGKVLAEALCYGGAYQYTNFYAVLDDKLTKVDQVLANQYNVAGYDKKSGYAYVAGEFKARGLGDCWVSEEAVWNGKIFLHSGKGSSGSCKGFGGGAWGQLPIFSTNIVTK
ncbi:DUF1176 domain-containing protein [Aggregatibacter kilianii]|uniref:DUF1176 domain-containing protein n=1 Tax=Aggregatibacter kilianii TaxID=2025884 RepID=UPI000D658DED|nr:DUF1176 domain-containing protein [Aggregatibacter kilianii]